MQHSFSLHSMFPIGSAAEAIPRRLGGRPRKYTASLSSGSGYTPRKSPQKYRNRNWGHYASLDGRRITTREHISVLKRQRVDDYWSADTTEDVFGFPTALHDNNEPLHLLDAFSHDDRKIFFFEDTSLASSGEFISGTFGYSTQEAGDTLKRKRYDSSVFISSFHFQLLGLIACRTIL
jgi:hypothetical protein